MPWTESGPASCKCSRSDDPSKGHSPITIRDRRDARFKNSISKPPRKGKQTIGPSPGIARSNLEPGQSVFDDEPRFERGRFSTIVARDHINGFKGGERRNGPCGVAVSAVCEGASCGGDVVAKSTAKFGSSGLEYMNRRALSLLNLVAATVPGAPLYFGRIAAAAIMKHKFFRPKKIKRSDSTKIIRHVLFVRQNGRLQRHIFREWFGQKYPYRWDRAASCYVDIRIGGKATNRHDLTWAQAASRLSEEGLDCISTEQKVPQLAHSHDAHIREYRQYKLYLPIYENPVLGFFWLWLLAALAPGETSQPYIPSNIYREGKSKVGRRVTEKDLSLNEPGLDRLDQYYRDRWRIVAAGIERPKALTDRDKTIADHWWLVVKKCRVVPVAHLADAIQACMGRLVAVWNNWDESKGSFGTFADQAIDWEIQDFLKQIRRQVPVQRSINLNEPAADPVDDDDNPEPECPDTMRYDAIERQALTAKLRLVAERLDCLNWRERHVVEGRLALNGNKEAVSQEMLAAKLGLSERHVRRIERDAVTKLQRAVV